MTELLTAMGIIFVIAGVFLLGANYFRLAIVPALILAGIVAGQFIQEDSLLEIAQWGIAFLVFVYGVNLEFGDIRDVLRDSEVAAFGQFAVIGGIGYGAGVLLGYDALNAAYFAVAAALSSTIVGTTLLQSEIRENLVHGRLANSIHFIQDLIAVLLILILAAETFTIEAVGQRLAVGVGLLVFAFVISTYLFDYLLKLAEGSQELLLISSVSILIGFMAISEFLGMSIVVGAFAAGLAIKRDFTRNLGMLNGIQSIRDFFVAIFFVTVGALVAIPTLEIALTALVLMVLTVLVKPLIIIATLLWEGYDTRAATFTSLSLDQVSEFALIIAIQAFILDHLLRELFDAIVLAAAVTMITSSFTRRHDDRIYRVLSELGLNRFHGKKTDTKSRIDSGLRDHVIIVGFGRIGRQLASQCEQVGREYVVIENDPVRLEDLKSSCTHFVFGDALHDYTWEKAQHDSAQLIVSTVDTTYLSERILTLDTDAEMMLRSSNAEEARSQLQQGADYVIIPDLLATEQLTEHLGDVLSGDVDREALREHHLETLDEFEQAGFASLGKTDFEERQW
ncbi:cation:proton antiporter [Halorubrum tibetense]|uniref:Cation:proton antiporter n=1 Tax=Halorubrum tibetense TaxID=175631 RepID=A0ABD5S7D1_9EURY